MVNNFDNATLAELSKQTVELVKLPLTLRKAILMSQGIWNKVYYDKEEIERAFKSTDWKAREKRNLFLDHKDYDAGEWIGEVNNMFFKNDTLYGDLIVSDPSWATKLKYGNPKIGISPKVKGDVNEEDKTMHNFTFENFSLVLNPAVKTAYINNMEDLKVEEGVEKKTLEEIENAKITGFETKRKQMGLSPAQFYAVPRTPPSASKLPIFDAAHVRNAMARFNQVQGLSPAERASARRKVISAANKYGIKVGAFKKLSDAQKALESMLESPEKEQEEKQMEESAKDLADLFELFEAKGLSVTKIMKKVDEIKKEDESLKDVVRRAGRLLEDEAPAEEEAPKEEPPAEAPVAPAAPEAPAEEEKPAEGETEEVTPEVEEKMNEMKAQIKTLTEKLNEPERKVLKKTKELSENLDNPDLGMINFLRHQEEVSTGDS